MFTKEEISVEDGHGLVVVTHRPTSTCVAVIQTGIWRQHELPAAGHSIRKLQVLTERVAIQPLIEAQCLEYLAPVRHVAAGEELDLQPRARRERMVGTSGPFEDTAAVRVEQEEPACHPPKKPFSWCRIRHLRPADTADLPGGVVLVHAPDRCQIPRVQDDVVVEVDDDGSRRGARSEVPLAGEPGDGGFQRDTAATHGLGEAVDQIPGWGRAGIHDHDFRWTACLGLK